MALPEHAAKTQSLHFVVLPHDPGRAAIALDDGALFAAVVAPVKGSQKDFVACDDGRGHAHLAVGHAPKLAPGGRIETAAGSVDDTRLAAEMGNHRGSAVPAMSAVRLPEHFAGGLVQRQTARSDIANQQTSVQQRRTADAVLLLVAGPGLSRPLGPEDGARGKVETMYAPLQADRVQGLAVSRRRGARAGKPHVTRLIAS